MPFQFKTVSEAEMFRVDATSKMWVPPLLKPGAGATIYGEVEITHNLPVWILFVLHRDPATGISRWRRFLVHGLYEALQLSQEPQWLERRLYVWRPDDMQSTAWAEIDLCKEIWECDERDGNVCARVETERGAFLDSLVGTPLGQETKVRQLWKTTDEVSGFAPPL
jgi:hypothetical protein